jgi:hypothetical protein
MSYIDTVDHSYVGRLFGWPVYHPLGVYTGDEFDADPTNLVIGGGSGEHPGMVIRSLDACILQYIEFCYEYAGQEEPDWLLDLHDEVAESYVNLFDHTWPMQSVSTLAIKAKAAFEEVVANKIKPLPHIENMLAIMIGEFLYYSARRLLSEKVNVALIEHFKDVWAFSFFEVITVPSKGYPPSGRRLVIENGESKVVWGLRFDDEQKHLDESSLSS